MKVPEGYTEQEVIDTLELVAERYKTFTFAYYDQDDIKQECFLFGLDALERYITQKSPDISGNPLENFLAKHIRNRLINLKRKVVSRTIKTSSKFDILKKLIAYPLPIEDINDEQESRMHSECILFSSLSFRELMHIINIELDVSHRLEFLKLLEGKIISKTSKDKIVNCIKEIISTYEDGA